MEVSWLLSFFVLMAKRASFRRSFLQCSVDLATNSYIETSGLMECLLSNQIAWSELFYKHV